MVDTPEPRPQDAPAIGPVRRALKNAGWLLAGKGLGGVFSLIYMGLVARSLGMEQFGIFALVLAYVQSIAALAKFESWQTVIRYGARHLEENAPARLRRILNFSTALDLGSALVGALIGVLGVSIIGPHLGWSTGDQTIAAYSCILLLFNIRGTPLGILRLFDRFDIAAFAEAVLPSVRLVGALMAWMIGASVLSYMAVWVLAELITALAIWWSALRELGRKRPDVLRGALFDVTGVRDENPGLWSFSWTTNLDVSLKQVWKHLPVLVVGWAVDTVAAGGFRIASNLVNGIVKPSTVLAWAIFPELARLTVTEPGQIGEVVRKTTLASAIIAGVTLLLTVLFWALGALGLGGRRLRLRLSGADHPGHCGLNRALRSDHRIRACGAGLSRSRADDPQHRGRDLCCPSDHIGARFWHLWRGLHRSCGLYRAHRFDLVEIPHHWAHERVTDGPLNCGPQAGIAMGRCGGEQ